MLAANSSFTSLSVLNAAENHCLWPAHPGNIHYRRIKTAGAGGKQWVFAVFNTESEAKLLIAASIVWKWPIKNKVYKGICCSKGLIDFFMRNPEIQDSFFGWKILRHGSAFNKIMTICQNVQIPKFSTKSMVKMLFPDFVWRVCPKILDLGYFVLIWWQTDKKQ